MRPALILAALFSAASVPALAAAQAYDPAAYAQAEPQVSVAVGPELAARGQRIGIDERDFAQLQRELRDVAARALSKAGPNGPVRADLVLYDAVPNRPTMTQYGREISLSMRSVGIGGAEIRGTLTFADGHSQPVRYRWYESDIRQEIAADTWYDASRAFQQFGSTLRSGKLDDHGWGQAGPNAGAFGRPNAY